MKSSNERNSGKNTVKSNSRRAFLSSAALVIPATAAAVTAKSSKADSAFKSCPRAKGGPTASRFPQVIVEDQFKRKAWFYEEMVNEKLVVVSFTSVKGERYYPVLDNLVKVQNMLKDRLGKDVFMYTITTNPEKDSPQDLKELAEKHGANWQFITGKAENIREILKAFNARGSLHALTWIGNEETGRWLNKPSRLHPLYIAEAVARLSTGKDHKPFLVDMHSV